jgi:hypothetical protein
MMIAASSLVAMFVIAAIPPSDGVVPSHPPPLLAATSTATDDRPRAPSNSGSRSAAGRMRISGEGGRTIASVVVVPFRDAIIALDDDNDDDG